DFLYQTLHHHTHLPNIHVTCRPHPAGLRDYSDHISSRFPTVTIDKSGQDFTQLVLGYDAVITLNSAAAFEALLCRIPAMTYSKGFYNCAFQPPPDSLAGGMGAGMGAGRGAGM